MHPLHRHVVSVISIVLLFVAITSWPVTAPAVEAWDATYEVIPHIPDHFPPGLSGGSSLTLMCSGPRSVADRIITIHDPPSHGQAKPWNNDKKWLEYHPDPGFTGTDSFTWSVSEPGGTSGIVTATIEVAHWNDRDRRLVDLVIKPALLASAGIEERIERLADDIRADGFRCRITPWSGTAAALWQHLHDSYLAGNDPGEPLLHGAILFGDIPKLDNCDLLYCFLDELRTTGDVLSTTHFFRHIWISRLADRDPARLINALDANHRYRRGISRLPASAWDAIDHKEWTSVDFQDAAIEQVWPDVRHNANPNSGSLTEAMTAGGEYVFRSDHGAPSMPNGPYQVRFAFVSGCESLSKTYGPHTYQGTAGGGNLISVGSSEETPGYTFNVGEVLKDRWDNEQQRWLPPVGIPMLNTGASWGQILMAGGFVRGTFHATRCHIFGDLTLSVNQTPANVVPTVTVTADPIAVTAGEEVVFTATIADTDAAASDSPHCDFEHRIEWYLDGYDRYGSIPPSQAGDERTAGWSTCRRSYERSHRFTARVEVMDEWYGRSWQEISIPVAPDPLRPLRIDAGRSSSNGDWADHQGDIWLYDQTHSTGIWGWSDKKDYHGSKSLAVADTERDRLFQTWREIPYPTTDRPDRHLAYHIPLTPGTYRVTLHFADLLSASSGKRILDAQIEGTTVLSAFDTYAVAGPATAVEPSFVIELADDSLDIALLRHPDSTEKPSVAGISIVPLIRSISLAVSPATPPPAPVLGTCPEATLSTQELPATFRDLDREAQHAISLETVPYGGG